MQGQLASMKVVEEETRGRGGQVSKRRLMRYLEAAFYGLPVAGVETDKWGNFVKVEMSKRPGCMAGAEEEIVKAVTSLLMHLNFRECFLQQCAPNVNHFLDLSRSIMILPITRVSVSIFKDLLRSKQVLGDLSLLIPSNLAHPGSADDAADSEDVQMPSSRSQLQSSRSRKCFLLP